MTIGRHPYLILQKRGEACHSPVAQSPPTSSVHQMQSPRARHDAVLLDASTWQMAQTARRTDTGAHDTQHVAPSHTPLIRRDSQRRFEVFSCQAFRPSWRSTLLASWRGLVGWPWLPSHLRHAGCPRLCVCPHPGEGRCGLLRGCRPRRSTLWCLGFVRLLSSHMEDPGDQTFASEQEGLTPGFVAWLWEGRCVRWDG